MESSYVIASGTRPLHARVVLPGSKSITNRALPMAALAHGTTTLSGALFSDDSRYCMEGLRALGYTISADEGAEQIVIEGNGVAPMVTSEPVSLFVGNSGTTSRFLTAFATLGRGTFRVDGTPRMRERPIVDLLSALRQLGADVEDELGTGCPPVRILANGLTGGTARISGKDSSQFVTALLLAAPYAQEPVEIVVDGTLVSTPYVDMTVAMMAQFGVSVQVEGAHYRVSPGRYAPRQYAIEPDASGATYFLAAAAARGGRVTVQGLGRDSLQGDAKFVDVLAQMGCTVSYTADGVTVEAPTEGLRGVDVDLFDMSDTVPTLAALAPLATTTTYIRNVANVRLKETDRIHACVTELRKFGVTVEEYPDGMRIEPCNTLREGVHVETYDDHRMAMAFSVLGLRVPGTVILDPGCVAKTFPDFFTRFAKMLEDVT